MKPSRKLRQYIGIRLGLLALLMIGVYSILVEFSLVKGMEETAAFNLRRTAADFERAYKENPSTPLPEWSRLKAYLGERDLPEWFIAPKSLESGKLLTEEIGFEDSGSGNCLVLIMVCDLFDGRRLYLIETYTEQDDIPGAFRYSENLDILILAMGIGFILLIFMAVRAIFRRVSASLESLADWAGGLTRDSLEQPRPGFAFREVDQLADLIQNAVRDLHQALGREHFFLRSASHELRTPIAVLRSNMDLLERLRPDLDDGEKAVYRRMDRAVNTMRRLTETLLWLSRKDEHIPLSEPADIGSIVNDLVEENRYLLKGKNVELQLHAPSVFVSIPKAACRIALANLIRNAFQYTGLGTVEIRVKPDAVIITNTGQVIGFPGPNEADFGFGLGLILVSQIARKLNLAYENGPFPGGHRAVLHLLWDDDSKAACPNSEIG